MTPSAGVYFARCAETRKPDLEAMIGRLLVSNSVSVSRPLDVRGGRPVTAFTSDIDLVPNSFVKVAIGVVVLAEVRRVALGAHVVPGLVKAGPVQWVLGCNSLVGV